MTKDDKDIVSALRTALADRVGNDHLQLWLGHPQSLALEQREQCEAGVVVVRAAAEFALRRLQKNLRTDLLAAVEQVLGPGIAIEYRIDPALQHVRAAHASRATKKLIVDPNQKVFSFSADGDQPAAENLITDNTQSIESTVTNETAAPLVTNPVTCIATVAETPRSRAARKFAQLDSFVVGDENRLAHSAALTLPNRLGDLSPLYVYGPTSSGKTHLCEGIWSAVRKASPQHRCLYLAAEQFTTLFLEALHGKGLPSFRRKYRDVDLLIIDDIQFLHGKRATLQELLAAVDHFAAGHKQLVLAADRAPSQLPGLGDELVARLSSGLVVEIAPAGVATKRAILERIVLDLGRHFPSDVLDHLAAELPSDARMLRGAVNRLLAIHEATGAAISVRLLRETCRDLLPCARRLIQLADIEKAVCEVFGLPNHSLQSNAKARAITQPRMLALWLSRKLTRAGLTEIGSHFGLKSHSTVLAAQKKVEGWLSENNRIRLAQHDCEIQDAIRRVELELKAS